MVRETPAMAQYADAKRKYPDAILFFRMGDFYEMFYDDARVASEALGLTLTARDRERKIPMAGVPAKAAEAYVQRLLAKGHKVAICEQMTPPGEANGVIEREVVRVLTPGTLTEEEALDPRRSNFLLALRPAAKGRGNAGLAWVDLSTGRFLVAEVASEDVADEVARIAPTEILLADEEGAPQDPALLGGWVCARTTVPAWTFDPESATQALKQHFALASLRGFGLDRMPQARAAAGAALEYLRETQLTSLGHVTRIECADPQGVLWVDRTTRRRLDLIQRADGSSQGTLVSVLDATRTAMGGRMLREWILTPLADADAINRRLDGVEEFTKDGFLRRDLREALRSVKDIERIVGKIATQRANARDLQALGRSLETLPALQDLLQGCYSGALAGLRERIDSFEDLASLLARAILDDPPLAITDGGMIRSGHHAELDELRGLSRDAKEWIARYQAREAARTGISSLKVGYNRVFGYYIEITHAHRDRVPAEYTRKQTLTSAERYVTPELDQYEKKVLHADELARDLERRIFQTLRDEVATRIAALQAVASVLAELDVLSALAETACARAYVRPEILSDRTLELRDARHPVVEISLSGTDRFVPNDTDLDAARRVALITGPNMAGKSTYIRQTALIVLMAQMGSFVPATKARIGLCDRLFARVGAEDDITRGQSTFMVEMSEAAYILHHATERSLIILDEVGRGTSTFDGIAIAWALSEYLSEVVGARTLFATHYGELTALSDEFPAIHNLNVAVREWGDSIVFLRRIQPGSSDRSYGIHVAQLAGVPAAVVERARAVLQGLEGKHDQATQRLTFGKPRPHRPNDLQLGLFAPAEPHPVLEELKAVDVNTLTPIQALAHLADLVRRAGGEA